MVVSYVTKPLVKETPVTEPRAKAVYYTDVPALTFGDEAPGVTIRWVIDEKNDGAPNYALRMIDDAVTALVEEIGGAPAKPRKSRTA